MDLTQQLAAIILPVLVVPAIGFIWAKSGNTFDNRFITQLVTNIGTPALTADALTRIHMETSTLLEMAGLTVLCFLGFALLGVIVLRVMGLANHSYLPALMFPNTGNMGLPLALFAFGDEGLAFAVVFFAISITAQFTIGMSLAAGSFSIGRLLRMPMIYAIIAALFVLATGAEVPPYIGNTLQLLGGLTIPLMLLALGVSLAQLRVTRLPRNLFLSLVRLVGGATIGFLVGYFSGASDLAIGVLMIQSTMPVAVFNYLFAQYYNREPADVASMVVITTALSFVTLPVLLYLVL
ncbi:AEC family transporter [Dongia sp.]|uniref:AEC family transporter n=1 Tax=Dongia sp. TaxID=1977262 RepID=UPI0035B3A372